MLRSPDFEARVDAQTEHVLMQLRAALAAANTARVVLVCDPVQDDTLLTRAKQFDLPVSPIELFTAAQSEGPSLIDVVNEQRHETFVNDSVRAAVIEAMQPARWDQRVRSVCGWLLTDRPRRKLVSAITQRANFVDEQGMRRTFRFWDPRAMQHAKKLFGRGRNDSGMLGIGWALIDSFGNWQFLPPPVDQCGWQMPAYVTLREFSLMNAAFQRLSACGVSRGQGPQLWPSLREGVQVGQRLGMTADDDLIWFAADRERLRAPLENAEELDELYVMIKKGRARYVHAVADYDEAEWQAIVASIPQTNVSQGVMQ